ncbi:hypothetical protein EVJ58_g6895 [Rhodofomes roseus]|uniref:Uncharacterized protein n=1 Tax=Rhodofomes roseus TaxID=34475 RepID=A0A4Y9Y6Y0_9APHY|nr:hypothetical protein EVJ58_g6895 [Rhodofomes roseus]
MTTRVAEQENYKECMPFARQPLKAIYIAQRMFTTLVMVLWWTVYYTVTPRKHRPRPSWSLKQIICVNFTRRIYKVTELAGVTWGTRNPEETCDNRSLKETRFEWIEPLPEEMQSGVIVDSQAECKRVGVFTWPRDAPKATSSEKHDPKASEVDLSDVEAGDVPVIGIFMHGGGYCHMSAHENAPTSKIPRRLMKDKAFTQIYGRLLQHAPFPAQVQDAAAVYYHIVQQHQRQNTPSAGSSELSSDSRNTNDGNVLRKDYLTADHVPQHVKDRAENEEARGRMAQAARNMRCKIVLIGDSAGDGLLLLSPSCDPSHAFPESPSSYVPRPHADTDYLVDTPEPRALLQRTFLGNHPLEMMHSPYVSPASQKVLRAFYGDAFAESVQDLTIARLNSVARAHLRTMESAPNTPEEGPPAGMELGRSPTSLERPIIASPRGLSLFSEFPRACVVLGDAERLEREVTKLVGAMERDGVEVKTVWVKDGAHDVLMMGWWDEDVRTKVYNDIEAWLKEV